MGHRLSKIVTRTGDSGTTGLGDGSRVGKDSARIEALGAVDELNCALGLLLAETPDAAVRERLQALQQDLFDLGGDLAIPGRATLAEARVARLERWVEEWNAGLPPLREFILPGGCRAAALAHAARAVCRRAERALVALAGAEAVAPVSLPYLNRLSDLLFVLARALNRDAGVAESQWQPQRGRET